MTTTAPLALGGENYPYGGFCQSIFSSVADQRSTKTEVRAASLLVTYVFRLWGLIFGNLTTQLLKLNSFVLSKNLGEILFSNLYIFVQIVF